MPSGTAVLLLCLLPTASLARSSSLRGGAADEPKCPDGRPLAQAEAGCLWRLDGTRHPTHSFEPATCSCTPADSAAPPAHAALAPALICEGGADAECGDAKLWPTVYLTGSGRCGSTSFSAMLKEHPDFVETQLVGDDSPWRAKELSFWGEQRGDDLAWYLQHFPVTPERLPEARAGALRAIDATPAYSSNPFAAAAIKEAYPAAAAAELRFLQIVRNPTDRFLSYYCRMVSGSRDWSWLAEAAEAIGLPPTDTSALPELAARAIAAVTKCEAEGSGLRQMTECAGWRGNNLFKVLADGLYLEQARSWSASFPLEQMLLTTTDVLKNHPAEVMRAAFRFAGMRTSGLGRQMSWEGASHESVRTNSDGHKCGRSTLDAGAVAALDAFFAPHNRALARWLRHHQGAITVADAAIADVESWAAAAATTSEA